MTANESYSLLIRDNLTQAINMQLSHKEKKIIINCFLQFWNLYEIWNIFKKKMTLVADAFPKLRTQENVNR